MELLRHLNVSLEMFYQIVSHFLFFSFLIMIITDEKSRAKFIRERGEEGPMC